MSNVTSANLGQPTGRFEKRFTRFVDGLAELKKVSTSIADSLGNASSEAEAVTRLALNVSNDAPTGNGVEWNRCSLSIKAHHVDYVTVGGLCYGWEANSSDFQPSREEKPEGGNVWSFYLVHPQGGKMRPDSGLRHSALAAGWTESLDYNVINAEFDEDDDVIELTFRPEVISRAKSKAMANGFDPMRDPMPYDFELNDEELLGESTLAKLRGRRLLEDDLS